MNAISEVGNMPKNMAAGITLRYLNSHARTARKNVRLSPVSTTSSRITQKCFIRNGTFINMPMETKNSMLNRSRTGSIS